MAKSGYIDREEVFRRWTAIPAGISIETVLVRMLQMVSVVEQIPAADVAPVVHGRWDSSGRCRFTDGSIAVRCTKCGCSLHEKEYTENVWNYCPVCGSVMDLEE